jgi:hypothetical protein
MSIEFVPDDILLRCSFVDAEKWKLLSNFLSFQRKTLLENTLFVFAS